MDSRLDAGQPYLAGPELVDRLAPPGNAHRAHRYLLRHRLHQVHARGNQVYLETSRFTVSPHPGSPESVSRRCAIWR